MINLSPRRKERLERISIAFAICHDLKPQFIYDYARRLLSGPRKIPDKNSSFAAAVGNSALNEDYRKVYAELVSILRQKFVIR